LVVVGVSVGYLHLKKHCG